MTEKYTFGMPLKDIRPMTKEERQECGFKGHEFVCSDEAMMTARHMCQLFKDHMNTAFEKWTPRERYEVIKI